jgi:shikimate dehydrogenase
MPGTIPRLAGVIGWPVAHSRSPLIHGTWLERHGVDGAYLKLPVRPGQLATAVRGLAASGFAGANVTVPHKEAAFAVCDTTDADAWRAGAVNTLVFDEEGRIHGTNTDGAGFLANLAAHGIDPAAGPALVLGAGGAARAIAWALAEAGAAVTLANRTAERAEALAALIPGAETLPWTQRADALSDHALLVNTTSLGMAGHPDLLLDLSGAPVTLAVCDIVYVPRRTKLLEAAAALGLRTADGLGMLLEQARPGFAAWFGVMPTIDEALRARVDADLMRG